MLFLRTDVYWFPLVTPAYAADLIAIMEGYGKWSNGKNDVSIDTTLFRIIHLTDLSEMVEGTDTTLSYLQL